MTVALAASTARLFPLTLPVTIMGRSTISGTAPHRRHEPAACVFVLGECFAPPQTPQGRFILEIDCRNDEMALTRAS